MLCWWPPLALPGGIMLFTVPGLRDRSSVRADEAWALLAGATQFALCDRGVTTAASAGLPGPCCRVCWPVRKWLCSPSAKAPDSLKPELPECTCRWPGAGKSVRKTYLRLHVVVCWSAPTRMRSCEHARAWNLRRGGQRIREIGGRVANAA